MPEAFVSLARSRPAPALLSTLPAGRENATLAFPDFTLADLLAADFPVFDPAADLPAGNLLEGLCVAGNLLARGLAAEGLIEGDLAAGFLEPEDLAVSGLATLALAPVGEFVLDPGFFTLAEPVLAAAGFSERGGAFCDDFGALAFRDSLPAFLAETTRFDLRTGERVRLLAGIGIDFP
jgi:hypothetical protein